MPLVQELRRRGNLAAMFAFGDWHRRDMHLRHRLLDALGFLCIHGGSWENGSGGLKSMVDSIMKRAIKWMPQWFPACDTYVLATGDRDFAHDASDLRWRGYQVWIAAGEASINNELRLGADEFISLDRLPGRVAPSVLLGVPANYYETTFGARRSFRSGASAPVAGPSGPATPVAAMTPAPVEPVAPVPPAPRPAALAAAAPAVVTPPPPVVVSDEDQALLAQLRELAGDRGFVPQREALRALAPADDPGGRVRSRLSNQIRDLVERNLLVRTHATIGGNVTQVLALPGVTIAPVAAPVSEPGGEPEAAGERRGRRPRRRGRGGAEALDELAPAAEAPADLPAVSAPAEIGEPWVVEPAEPVGAHAGEAPPPPVAAVATVAPAAAEPAVAPEEHRWEPARPVLRRVERPVARPAGAPEPAGPAPARPSWREAVAAALARVRGEAASAAVPAAPPAPPAAAPPVSQQEAAPPAVEGGASGEPSAPAGAAVSTAAASADAEPAGPARRRRRRRATGAATAEAPALAAPSLDEAAGPVAATDTESAAAAPATAEEAPRRRSPHRRRPPAELSAPDTDLAGG